MPELQHLHIPELRFRQIIMLENDTRQFYDVIRDTDFSSETRLITVVDGGSAGEKALITGSGITWHSNADGFIHMHEEKLQTIKSNGLFTVDGTIGGGCIEGTVIAKGRRMLLEEEHEPVVMEVDITKDTAEDEGMVCGGKIQVMLEVV